MDEALLSEAVARCDGAIAAGDDVRRWLGFALPAECEAGVAANLAALADHAALLRAALDRIDDRRIEA